VEADVLDEDNLPPSRAHDAKVDADDVGDDTKLSIPEPPRSSLSAVAGNNLINLTRLAESLQHVSIGSPGHLAGATGVDKLQAGVAWTENSATPTSNARASPPAFPLWATTNNTGWGAMSAPQPVVQPAAVVPSPPRAAADVSSLAASLKFGVAASAPGYPPLAPTSVGTAAATAAVNPFLASPTRAAGAGTFSAASTITPEQPVASLDVSKSGGGVSSIPAASKGGFFSDAPPLFSGVNFSNPFVRSPHPSVPSPLSQAAPSPPGLFGSLNFSNPFSTSAVGSGPFGGLLFGGGNSSKVEANLFGSLTPLAPLAAKGEPGSLLEAGAAGGNGGATNPFSRSGFANNPFATPPPPAAGTSDGPPGFSFASPLSAVRNPFAPSSAQSLPVAAASGTDSAISPTSLPAKGDDEVAGTRESASPQPEESGERGLVGEGLDCE
jgi:hypothetical protein